MDQKHRYHTSKVRNEHHLLDIIQLEQEIAHVQQQIDNKRRSTRDLQQKKLDYQHRIQLHQKYQTCLQPKSKEVGRHDLSQLLTVSADTVCTKLQAYIERQLSAGQPLSSLELTQIQHWVKRLSNPSLDEVIDQLLTQIQQQRPQEQDKERPLQPTQLSHPKQDQVSLLVNELSQLEKETASVEAKLIQRIRATHQDHSIQSALSKNLRMKAACLQAKTELEFNRKQLAALDIQLTKSNVALSSETKRLKEQTDQLLEQLAEKHKQIQTFIKLNQRFQDTFRTNHDQHHNESESVTKRIRESMEALKCPTSSLKKSHDPSPLDAIKKELVPSIKISDTQMMIEIKQLIDSVNQLSQYIHKDNSDQEELTEMIKRWSQSVKMDLRPQDTAIQSIDRLREHIEKKEQEYIRQQEAILREKLKTTESIEKELVKTEQALNER
ncbi:hypothetical protein A0J61_05898 [Choanephora cucurbitarum]|uniref:Uncharacterized protein n=1 Tax=Choanephora cucurbitarum TaxID=101091 RepID=A0A1C7NA90_9FUNG|nr:hypothetical protein A0J61_05898 [Choanephora cucurbitarum]